MHASCGLERACEMRAQTKRDNNEQRALRALHAHIYSNRAKLSACVRAKIAEMYPDTEGEATKVGYKQ